MYDLGWRLKEIRSQEVSKNTKPEIKKAINIIRDNYKKYETQIEKKIAELNPKTTMIQEIMSKNLITVSLSDSLDH